MDRDLASLDDESLALAAKKDTSAFTELLRRYQVPLLGFLRRHARRTADAEDLLQETVFRLYAAREQYQSRWRFRTWAFTIARRVAVDAHRRQVREAASFAEFASASVDTAAHDSRVSSGSCDDLWAIARSILAREQADTLWLFHVEEIPPRQIALILDRSWVSVKTMLHRARRAVRAEAERIQNERTAAVRPVGGVR